MRKSKIRSILERKDYSESNKVFPIVAQSIHGSTEKMSNPEEVSKALL